MTDLEKAKAREWDRLYEENTYLMNEVENFRAACKAAKEYFEMLERATKVEHPVLKELRQALKETDHVK